MKKTTRRKYTDEFKDDAVKLETEQGYNFFSITNQLKIGKISVDFISEELPCLKKLLLQE